MPISSGGNITAAFYNSVQTTVQALLGTGGYYQTVTSAPIASGASVYAVDWIKLAGDINKCQQHQTFMPFSSAQLPVPVAGASVTSATTNAFETRAGIVNTNRYMANIANMTLSSDVFSITQDVVWGSGSTSIAKAFQADWGSVAAMNAFFNTGGEIRWSMSHPATSTPQDASWNTFLGALGPFDVHGGDTLSLTTSMVKWPRNTLTNVYKTIFFASNTATSYTSNSVTIQARINAAGTGVQVVFILIDGHTNSFYDKVSAGTKFTCSFLKATQIMTGITSPTYSIAPTS